MIPIIGTMPRKDMKVNCRCGWSGYIGECKQALWINMIHPTPVAQGGDGIRFRCPVCNEKLHEIYYTANPMPLVK